MNNDSSKQVLPDGYVVEISLPRFQESKLKLFFLRKAWLTWRKKATYVAKTAFLMRSAAHRHYVRELTDTLLQWRLYIRQRHMVELCRDPYGTYQKWWLLGELRRRFILWNNNLRDCPVVRVDGWFEEMDCTRLISIKARAKQPGKRGSPGKEVLFLTLSGERFIMPMAAFREWDGSKKAIADFKLKANQALDPSMPNRRTRRQQLESLNCAKSMAKFRSRSSSSGTSTPSLGDEDYSPSLEGTEQEKLDAVIKDRLGGASLARTPARDATHPAAGENDQSAKAVIELQGSLDLLAKCEADAEAREMDGTTKEELDAWEEKRQAQELSHWKQSLAPHQSPVDRSIRQAAKDADISPEMQELLDRTSRQQQATDVTNLLNDRLAQLERSMANVTATSLAQQQTNNSVSQVRQYNSQSEMKLESLLDGCTTVHAEQFSGSCSPTSDSCILDACSAWVPPGKKHCIQGHPVSVRQLICPWNGCGEPCSGTPMQQMLQPVCLRCMAPLPHSQTDPAVKLDLMKKIAEEKEKEKFENKPTGNLQSALPAAMRFTESQTKLFRLHRSTNSELNFLIASKAETPTEAIEELEKRAARVPKSKILGSTVDFDITERALMCFLAGGTLGFKDSAFKLYELAQSAGCLQDKQFLKWTASTFKDTKTKEPEWNDAVAPNWIKQYIANVTVLIRHCLSSQFAEDHERETRIFIAAMENEWPKFQKYSPQMIFRKYTSTMQDYYAKCIAFVEDSSYFEEVFGKDLLWNNYGTHKQIPKFVIRYFRGGCPVWISLLDELYDEPARQEIIAQAMKTLGNKPNMKYGAITHELCHDYNDNVKRKVLARNGGIKGFSKYRHVWWPGVEGWVKLTVDICHKCLRIACNHCTVDCPVGVKQHKAAYISNKGQYSLNLKLFAQATEIVSQSQDETGEGTYSYNGKPDLEIAYKQLLIDAYEEQTSAQIPALGGKAQHSEVIRVWMEDTPEPRPDIPQPTLKKQEARFEFSKPTYDVGHLQYFESKPESTLKVALILPAISRDDDHRFSADAIDIGSDFIMPSGQIQRRKCPLMAVCEDKKIPVAKSFGHLVKDAVRFQEASPELHRKYANLNHVTKLDIYLKEVYKSISDVATNGQESDYMWLRQGWLKEFGDGPIAVWFEQAGKVVMKLFVLAAAENQCSQLQSPVTHILGHQGHAHILKWHDGLEQLQDVLVVAPRLYRFLDLSLELCITMADTLAGKTPVVPAYLSIRKSLTDLVKFLEISGMPQLGGKDNQQQSTPTSELFHCSSCKRSQQAEFFTAGKLTCDACLTERRKKHQKKVSKSTRSGPQQVIARAISESIFSCAWHIESLGSVAAAVTTEEAQTEAAKWLSKVTRRINRLTTQIASPVAQINQPAESHGSSLTDLQDAFKELVQLARHHPDPAAALSELQSLLTAYSVRCDELKIPLLQKPVAEANYVRRIQSNTCLQQMEQQGASSEETERARITGEYGFFCNCPHGCSRGKCVNIVQSRGSRCIHCSNFSGMMLWFQDMSECRCYCEHCWDYSSSDSDEDTRPSTNVSMSDPAPAEHNSAGKRNKWQVTTTTVAHANKFQKRGGKDLDSMSHAMEFTLAAINVSYTEAYEVTKNGLGVLANMEHSVHPAINNATANLNLWVHTIRPFSDSTDFRVESLMTELVVLLNLVDWRAVLRYLMLIWNNLLLSCKHVRAKVGHWKWAANKLHNAWKAPIRSSQCLTLHPDSHSWYEFFRDICDTLSTDLPSLSCVLETESLCTALLERENKVYVNLDSIQSWADRTGTSRTLVLVWAKIAELLLDTAHLKTIVKAVHDTWQIHESPRTIINDAWMLDHNAVSLQGSAYAEECLQHLQQLYESGRNTVLNTLHQCQWPGCTCIAHCFSRESNLPIACTQLHLHLLTNQQSKSPRSPSSSFERLASPEAFGSNDDRDLRFDLHNMSPSVPLAWQRNFSLSPLKQYKFMWQRSRTSEEEEEWNLRIVDKYPKVQRRETGRRRNAPERLTLSASHSSLDTDVSSSVSPSGYKEAAGLDQGIQLSLRNASKQAQWLPNHLQMPSNQTIAESFNRTKQSKLSWQGNKLHSAKLRLCLLCERKMELEYCSKHPEKALHERVKLFCVHYWAGNNK